MSTEELTNSLGVPKAEFVQDVEAYMEKHKYPTAQTAIKKLDELFMKYSLMEQNLNAKKAKLNRQIPEIENNLQVLKFLEEKSQQKQTYDATYLLDYHLYSRAHIEPSQNVGLWLGANVMLEYPIEEAKSLLEKNLETAQKNLNLLENDLDFVKDQITTTEVNIARIYNWNVRQRQLTAVNNSDGDQLETKAQE